jgi:hypothetical protein
MRQIGEKLIGAIPQTKRTREGMNHNKMMAKTMVKLICGDCEKPFNISAAKIKRWGDNIKCYDCHHKGKDDIQQAMINLAKRKGLI